MGILSKVGKIIVGGIVAGPAGVVAVFTVEHGTEVLQGTIDVARQIVKIGTDVYKAIPPEVLALGGFPVEGLLKHVAEDEIILLGHIAGNAAIFSGLYWPLLGPVGATAAILEGAFPAFVAAGSLAGLIHTRHMDDTEWNLAQYVFRDTLYDRSSIKLTNLGGLDGRPFVYPIGPLGPVLVNLGGHYIHNASVRNLPVLLHELTHVWQARKRILNEIYLLDALNRKYDFEPGMQWREYGMEQQAAIVQAWALGATHRAEGRFDARPERRFAMGSPLFRYINGNIRRFDEGANTSSGHSVRQLLAEGGHHTVRAMHPPAP